jgi:hypothetical protein
MSIARLNFRRHFVLLACALAVIVIVAQLDVFGTAALLPDAAIYGALYAIAFAGALDMPATLARKGAFILSAAVLDVATLYLGIVSLGLLGSTPLGIALRAYMAFGISSMAGAICYGLLIRFFWLRDLSPRPIAQISLGCLVATLSALVLQQAIGVTGLWAVAAVWWCAFSIGLWIFGRAHSLRAHADA